MKAKELTQIALCIVIIAVCAMISIPIFAVPFTMQLFGVFLTCLILRKKSIFAVISYILLGMVGVPVFAGFKGGLQVILGPTGGFIVGFVFIALIVGLSKKHKLMYMIISLLVCYLFGSLWFWFVTKTSLALALVYCVLPYIIPDLIKLGGALLLYNRVLTKVLK